MVFVLFFAPDRSFESARKFPSFLRAWSYLQNFLKLGGINVVVASYDLQFIYFKTF